jgi:hypothetical protein
VLARFDPAFEFAAAIRALPGVVIRSLPNRSTMYPSPISRARCSAGITAGGSSTVVLPTVSMDANSSRVSFFDLGAIVRIWPRSAIVAWSTLLRSTNKGRLSWRPLSFQAKHPMSPIGTLFGHSAMSELSP